MAGNDGSTENTEKRWEGLEEIDRAISENWTTEYRVKKAWADPWERKGLIAFGLIIFGFAIFAVVYDLIL